MPCVNVLRAGHRDRRTGSWRKPAGCLGAPCMASPCTAARPRPSLRPDQSPTPTGTKCAAFCARNSFEMGGWRWLGHAGKSNTLGTAPSRVALQPRFKLLRLAQVPAVHNPSRDCRNPPLTARHRKSATGMFDPRWAGAGYSGRSTDAGQIRICTQGRCTSCASFGHGGHAVVSATFSSP